MTGVRPARPAFRRRRVPQFQGGTGGCGWSHPGVECGGGGGGGYFGGGGGGETEDPVDAPAGGGSGHVDGTAVTGGTTTSSANYIPPGTTQTQYVAGVGVGGGTGNTDVGSGDDVPQPGGNGLAVFEFAKLPTLTIAKTTLGGVGTFNFTGTNGIAATAITTVTAGVTVLSGQQTLTHGSTATTITEALVPNWQLTTATACTGMGSGGTATLNAATGVLSLNAAATVDGSNIVCTFVNAKLPIVQVAKMLLDPTGTGNTFGFGLTGVTPTTDSVVGVAGTTVKSGVVHPGTIGTPVVVTENSTTGLPLADYTTTMSCVDATGGNATITATGTAVTIPAANMSPNANWTCTATNTRKSTTLQVAKKWSANSIAGNTVTVTSSGFTNNATSGASVATAAGNTTTGTAVTVYAGESGSIAEAFSVGSASNYTSTLACTSGLSGSTLTISPTAGPIVCTETNTRKSATLKLIKTWAPGSTAGNTVSVNTTGFINNATSGTSVATPAGNSTTGTAVTVFAGETGPIGETFTVGSAANYTLTITNTGKFNFAPLTLTDDLTDVLDDAQYQSGSTGLTLAGSILTFSGDLPTTNDASNPLVVTYTVKVDSPDKGNGTLDNVITGGTSGGNCPSVTDCETSNVVAEQLVPLAFTGTNFRLNLIAAELLLGVGAGLLLIANAIRRRRPRA